MSDKSILLSIAVMAVITALLRFLPFVVFRGKNVPDWVMRLGKSLPCALMGMLVVYCLKDVSFGSAASFLPELIATVIVAVSYIFKKNTLLSIILGTICYMLLVQFVFV